MADGTPADVNWPIQLERAAAAYEAALSSRDAEEIARQRARLFAEMIAFAWIIDPPRRSPCDGVVFLPDDVEWRKARWRDRLHLSRR